MTTTTVYQIELPKLDSLGFPIRERHAGKPAEQIRREAHEERAEAAAALLRAQALALEEQRIKQAIHDHELSRLQRELAKVRTDKEAIENSAEAADRRARGTLACHQDPQIVRSKKAVLNLLHEVREGRTDIVNGGATKRLKRDAAISRLEAALRELEALVLEDYGPNATRQLTAILQPCGLNIPPSDEQLRDAAERMAAKEREFA